MATLDQYRTLTRMTAKMVADLRDEVFEGGVATEAEARALVRLAANVPDGDAAWAAFYCEALSEWVRREDGTLSARRIAALTDAVEASAPSSTLNVALMAAVTRARMPMAAPRRAAG